MTSRESILKSIRENKPKFSDLHETQNGDAAVATFPLIRTFIKNVSAAGGEIINASQEDADRIIAQTFPAALDFSKPEVREKFSATTALSELDKIECVVFEGHFGVAENGAVWIEDKDLPHRILPFITQKLVFKLNEKNIIPNMHEAYKSIRLSATGYGVFISGPSKTADIEQSLVYGAHGAVNLTVVLIQS
jgi:L-lactate dehydrogenase complex protein LldG